MTGLIARSACGGSAARIAETCAAMQAAGTVPLLRSDPSKMAWLTGSDGWITGWIVIGETGPPRPATLSRRLFVMK